MASPITETDVAIVDAGAAGLAAAYTLRELGVSFVLLEASHRIGGRAYTEEVRPGVPFDLGCHWMHSASRNPFVKIADNLGFHYEAAGLPGIRPMRINGTWASEADHEQRELHLKRNFQYIERAAAEGRDVSIAEVTEREGRWAPYFDYLISLWTSADADQVSVIDHENFVDTEENWPLERGYGTLVARYGADLPVALNSAVTRIAWSDRGVRLSTARGELCAKTAIVTVSTAILGSGHLRFDPALPDWKQEAIAALPLGNHNRICLVYDRNVFGPEPPRGATLIEDGTEPMAFSIRPFDYDYVVGMTGGRFADWLERAGIEASVDLAKENLKKAFGNNIIKHIVGHNVTAWRHDPWAGGAYSAAKPGQARQRARLAEPLDKRLFFAGEATSLDAFSSAHGAYQTGIETARAVARSIQGSPSVRNGDRAGPGNAKPA